MLKLRKFFRLPSANRWLVVETFILLGLARAAVLALPFRWLASVLGKQRATEAIGNEINNVHSSKTKEVAWAVRRISCHTPWLSNCLAKAVAGRFMLKRRKIASTIYFGLVKDSEGELIAHAWLKCGNMTLTGGSNLDRYTIVASFSD